MSRGKVAPPPPLPQVAPPPVGLVLDILEGLWGQEKNPDVQAFEEPLDGLVLIILSQNTNDRNRDIGFARLKEAAPTWAKAAKLSRRALIDLIRPAGLCDSKADTIRRALSAVKERTGSYSLKSFRGGNAEECWQFLTSIKGVGVKTAACVFVFDLGFPAFPVDTHVARFCRRMGWFGEKVPPHLIQEAMEAKVDDARKAGAHLNIITHGRRVCKARGPLCGHCPLRGLCPSSMS